MNGKIALVTGASRGIGAAIARVFQERGITVLAPTRTEMDMTDISSIERYIESVKGPIDILVNNAGINILAGLEEVERSVLNETLQVNLIAPIMLTKLVAEKMKLGRYGRIVNISSIWSMVAKERRIAYAASKSAMSGVTRTLALELAQYNILINSLAPGFVNTELTSQNNSPEQIREISNLIPLQRLAEPAEIAEMVAFLCSEKNSYMTGQVLVVDGGYICQ